MVVVLVEVIGKQLKTAEEPRNKASSSKENPPITTLIFSPQILYIGNKKSLAIRHEIN